jgi:signal transduction histidine kinase
MSTLEAPMWRALIGYRALTAGYAVLVFGLTYGEYEHPMVGVGYLAVLVAWTLLTLRRVSSAERCTPRFLAADLTIGVGGILLSMVADPVDTVIPTLPSIWVAGSVLAVALKGGWRWAAGASALVGVANLIRDSSPSRSTLHNVLLLCVASIAIGYVVELARASERTLARALRIEAATRERERLARDIHDSVLQVLAMVQRRGTALGGEAEKLGRMAGEQERALRALVVGGPVPPPREADGWAYGGAAANEDADEDADLDALLALVARGGGDGGGDSDRVTYAGPPGPVRLPAHAAREVAAAVGAALDNVRRHAVGPSGQPAHAWILLEDEPDAVLVTVRDDGPGIPAGRLAEAEAEGRLGVSLSIRGRLAGLGGSAEWVSVPGQGTEVELRLPKKGM